MGRNCSTAQKTDLLDRRRKLEARISTYEQRISYIVKLDDDVQWSIHTGKTPDFDPDPGEVSDDLLDDYPEGWFTPEKERITLPSALAPGEIARLSLDAIAGVEAELRKGQINDSLEGLRLALGEKSLCFRAEVRNANSQRTTQRAWDNIHKFDSEARKHRNMYNHTRDAIRRLPVEDQYLDTLQDITEGDMKMSGDITEENRFGQQSDTLAWFWRQGSDPGSDDIASPRMHECKFNSCDCILVRHSYVFPYSLSCHLAAISSALSAVVGGSSLGQAGDAVDCELVQIT
jgi:hypothetical protein